MTFVQTQPKPLRTHRCTKRDCESVFRVLYIFYYWSVKIDPQCCCYLVLFRPISCNRHQQKWKSIEILIIGNDISSKPQPVTIGHLIKNRFCVQNYYQQQFYNSIKISLVNQDGACCVFSYRAQCKLCVIIICKNQLLLSSKIYVFVVVLCVNVIINWIVNCILCNNIWWNDGVCVECVVLLIIFFPVDCTIQKQFR